MKLLTTFSLCLLSPVYSSSGVPEQDAQFDRTSYAGRAKRNSYDDSSSTNTGDYTPTNTGSSDSGQYNPVTSTDSAESSGGSPSSPYSPSTGGSSDSSGSGSGEGSGTGEGSGDTANTASATGDPHFRINFANKDDICFDLSGTQGQVFNLLADPVSGLIVNAKIVDSDDHKAHRLGEIGIISPEGNRLKVTPAGIVGEGPVGSLAYNFNYDNDLTFGDINFSINSRQRFRHVGASIRVDESQFEISVKEAKNALKFYIDAEAHAGNHDLDGLLGFTFSHSYKVIDQNIIKMKNEYLKYDYDHVESCLRVKYEDLVDKLARHQLHEKYLLGAPPSMNMLEDLIPK